MEESRICFLVSSETKMSAYSSLEDIRADYGRKDLEKLHIEILYKGETVGEISTNLLMEVLP